MFRDFIAVALMSTSTISFPVAAQFYGRSETRSGKGYEYQEREKEIFEMYSRVARMVERGVLTSRQGNRLTAQLDAYTARSRQYASNGYSSYERRDLDNRFEAILEQIRDDREGRSWEDDRRYDPRDN